MKQYNVEDMTIEFDEHRWQIITDTQNFMPTTVLELRNGSTVLQYLAKYAAAVGLPGDHMSTSYVQAVAVGYKNADLRWLLGLQILTDFDEKPRWVQLVRWGRAPATRYAAEAQEAGRVLAEYIGCPLKMFGVKKIPAAGSTGPLEQHERNDIDRATVEIRAAKMMYPGDFLDMKVEDRGNNGIALKVGRTAAASVVESPPYHNVEVDTRRQTVKMFPPTGLLGAFLGGARGREIEFAIIRNIELRYLIRHDAEMDKEDTRDGMATEKMMTTYEWQIHLTIPNETILLAVTSHKMSSDLTRKRATIGQTDSLNYKENVAYYRQLEIDQEAREKAKEWAERAAYIIASTIGCRLVETQVGVDYSS